MKIYEMTATFGKLNHETLTLKPGFNIIEAPNEWGKSTWCAFLIAMLYGMDTRAKTTKTLLADKEHYAPWSGQPMSGRMRISWQGRDITIERSTRGRIPLGEFSAYETETGIPVTELTGENCGEVLLGAEQAVFRRAGFVRLSDLPVTRDDALLRRLHALVTTGDESGDGERLARELKTLKNRCRYNRSGLLPQAEEELAQIQGSIQEFEELQAQSETVTRRIREENETIGKLKNHLTCLENQEAGADAQRVRQAEQQKKEAEEKAESLRAICKKLPSQQLLEKKRQQLQNLERDMDLLLKEESVKKPVAEPAPVISAFEGVAPQNALAAAMADKKSYERLQLNFTIVWILAAICCVAASVLFFALSYILVGVLFLFLAAGFLACSWIYQKYREDRLQSLAEQYGDEDPERWLEAARFYQESGVQTGRSPNARLEALRREQTALCGNKTISETLQKLQKIMDCREGLTQAEKELQQAENHLTAVKAMAKKSQKTSGMDDLFYDEKETVQRLQEAEESHRRLLNQLGQYQGRMEALGTEAQLQQQREALQQRISKLELYYEALVIALSSLEEAAQELQRKFAPRIVRRAQELMGRMTGGRYETLTLEEDFSLNTGAESENVLHSALWRSEGTVDQLYLSLRLAVSEALTPEAPLVLDDALVRFDRQRLERVLEILQEEEKQVILFTCQEREGRLCPQALTKME